MAAMLQSTITILVGRAGVALAVADGSGSGTAAAHLLIVASSEATPFGAATDRLYVILYGTGLRHAQGPTSCTLNDTTAAPEFAGANPGYPGLDQISPPIPSALRGAERLRSAARRTALTGGVTALTASLALV